MRKDIDMSWGNGEGLLLGKTLLCHGETGEGLLPSIQCTSS